MEISYYGEYIGMAEMASEAAYKQSKFPEMYKKLMTENFDFRDTSKYYQFADDIGLDSLQFYKDFNNVETKIKITNNFEQCKKIGLFGTPSAIYKNKLLMNPNSLEYIQRIIDSN